MSSLRDDNRRLEQTVTELRADRRAQERKLADLQHQLDELRGRVPIGAADGAVPVLPVEVAAPAPRAAAPDAARVVGVTEDGTEIVYEGDAAAGRPAVASPSGGEESMAVSHHAGARGIEPAAPRAAAPLADLPVIGDRLEVTRRVPPISARAAARGAPRDHEPSSERGGAASDYRAAVELVKASRYDAAIAALRAFVTRYPRHDYADNAQYWIGEAYYAQRDYAHALSEFRKVIEVYPRGNKVPDALLKVGYCYQAMGQGEKAHAVLNQVVTLYPRSEPATLAAKRLEAP